MSKAGSLSDASNEETLSAIPSSATIPPTDIVLIRGLVRARYHWGEFPQTLLAQLTQQLHQPDLNLIQPELPGNGDLFKDTTPTSINGMMHRIRDQVLAQQANHHRPIILIAISMGAMIATEWAQQFPHEIQQLHLINTSFGNFSAPWQRMRIPPLLSLLPVIQNTAQLETRIMRWTVNTHHSPTLLDQWIEFAQQHPIRFGNALRQITAASRYRAPKTAPNKNTFIYCSQNDQLVSNQCSHHISTRWQVPLYSHRNAGHDLPLDAPQWLSETICSNILID